MLDLVEPKVLKNGGTYSFFNNSASTVLGSNTLLSRTLAIVPPVPTTSMLMLPGSRI
ncbi:MAG: hypothetical protein N3G79_00840 [Sulfolobales archaeon]|nr:hypothetical protein [Sulfolobales archaeon]